MPDVIHDSFPQISFSLQQIVSFRFREWLFITSGEKDYNPFVCAVEGRALTTIPGGDVPLHQMFWTFALNLIT